MCKHSKQPENNAGKKVLVCTNLRADANHPSCAARNSEKLLLALAGQLPTTIEKSPCMGFCDIGPNIHIVPSGQYFHQVSNKNIEQIILEIKSAIES